MSANSPRGPPLDEEDDEHQDQDLAEHRAGIGLQELVGDAERQGAHQRTPEIAHAAEDTTMKLSMM